MLYSSLLAMFLGTLAILTYVTYRYEFSFAIGVIDPDTVPERAFDRPPGAVPERFR